jgi:glycosyltransferase involved in cell wall biosynthesis
LLGIVNMQRYRRAPLLADVAAETRALRVAVCIPARNEKANIEACVRSMLASREVDVRAYVYDDESTDGTGEIVARLAAEDARVVIVPRRPLPSGWNGKQHACFRMAEHGLGHDPALEWFLFTDADVRLEPDAVARALGFALRSKSSLVSTVPREITGSLGEMLLVPQQGALTITTELGVIEVAPGDFRAVWDSGTATTPRTHIQFGKFKLKP